MFIYKQINYEVMSDTQHQYENNLKLKSAIQNSISRQYMIAQEENLNVSTVAKSNTKYIISGKRSFEAAKCYQGKKVAVLNFANNHAIGGAPFYASAQEESLCRCSTLYPCLQAMKVPYYDKHKKLYDAGQINYMGNDDLIYTHDVVVFKTDERTSPVYPRMMPEEEWYKVDVITCAAPELWHGNQMPDDYEYQITRRIKRILETAVKENVEVLILGKWGCGAFCNPSETIARIFMTLLKNYNFETVEFALATIGNVEKDEFTQGLRCL